MSHEKLPVEPKDFVLSIWERSVARIAVVGMGAAGALLVRRSRQRGLPSPCRSGSTGCQYSGRRRRTLLLLPQAGWILRRLKT
jgi:hypothetical protein